MAPLPPLVCSGCWRSTRRTWTRAGEGGVCAQGVLGSSRHVARAGGAPAAPAHWSPCSVVSPFQQLTHLACPSCSYGTASIAAPELLSEGRLTKASDIYGECPTPVHAALRSAVWACNFAVHPVACCSSGTAAPPSRPPPPPPPRASLPPLTPLAPYPQPLASCFGSWFPARTPSQTPQRCRWGCRV